MPKIDESRPFIPVRIAVLTVSDTRGLGDDKSGDTLAEMIRARGPRAGRTGPSSRTTWRQIRAKVQAWIADPAIDVVITTGGTGFTGRDVTPEALKPLFEKEIDGFSTVFHMISFAEGGDLDDPVARLRRPRAGHLHFLPAGLAGRLQGRLERHSAMAARQPPPALQFRRDHAPAGGAPARQLSAAELEMLARGSGALDRHELARRTGVIEQRPRHLPAQAGSQRRQQCTCRPRQHIVGAVVLLQSRHHGEFRGQACCKSQQRCDDRQRSRYRWQAPPAPGRSGIQRAGRHAWRAGHPPTASRPLGIAPVHLPDLRVGCPCRSAPGLCAPRPPPAYGRDGRSGARKTGARGRACLRLRRGVRHRATASV